MKWHYLVFIGAFSVNLLGCSESKDETQLSHTDNTYVVSDSFDVGRNVVVRALDIDKKSQQLWVGTSLGALQIDVATGNLLNTYTRENGLANEYVFAVMLDGKGQAWLGTNGGGVSWHQNEKWKTFFPMHGLADYWVYSFTEQDDGTVWIGTWAGLNKYSAETKTFTTYLKELVNEWVYGLDVDSKGQLWVGTEGGVNMFDGKTWYTWTHKEGLGAPNDEGLPFSANTGLGTRHRHDLSVLQAGKETYNPNYVFCIIADNDDQIWAGTWGGGVSTFDGKRWRNYTERDGLAGNIVYSVNQASDGTMWFGTNKGISRFDGKKWQQFTMADGLLHNHVYAIVTNNNHVWAGTQHGVVKLTRKTEQNI